MDCYEIGTWRVQSEKRTMMAYNNQHPLSAEVDNYTADIAGQYDQNGKKIPRPMNAFMLFSHRQRPKIKIEFPKATNKEISVKLGDAWTGLTDKGKDEYYTEARKAEREHRVKYPEYRYCPGASKIAKTIKRKREEQRRLMLASYQAMMTANPDLDLKPTYPRKRCRTANSTMRGPVQAKVQQYNSARQPAVQQTTPLRAMFQRDVVKPYSYPSSWIQQAPIIPHHPLLQTVPHTGGSHMSGVHNPTVQSQPHPTSQPIRNETLPNSGMFAGMSGQLDSSTDGSFVMIPCDISFARKLGWPVHMLQQLPSWMYPGFTQDDQAPVTEENQQGESMGFHWDGPIFNGTETSPQEGPDTVEPQGGDYYFPEAGLSNTMQSNSYTDISSSDKPFIFTVDQSAREESYYPQQQTTHSDTSVERLLAPYTLHQSPSSDNNSYLSPAEYYANSSSSSCSLSDGSLPTPVLSDTHHDYQEVTDAVSNIMDINVF